MSANNDEIRKLLKAIENDLNNQNEHRKALDIDSHASLSLSYVQSIPELNNFFGLDEDGPYSEVLNKGLRSLRRGFYKLCGPPFYNRTIYPNTFAADVYYFNPDSTFNTLIKYQANIGPMTNVHKIYAPLNGTFDDIDKIPILKKFEHNKYLPGNDSNYYYKPKLDFFNTLYNQNKVFFVLESIFDPAFPHANPKPKKVTWSFIDY